MKKRIKILHRTNIQDLTEAIDAQTRIHPIDEIRTYPGNHPQTGSGLYAELQWSEPQHMDDSERYAHSKMLGLAAARVYDDLLRAEQGEKDVDLATEQAEYLISTIQYMSLSGWLPDTYPTLQRIESLNEAIANTKSKADDK